MLKSAGLSSWPSPFLLSDIDPTVIDEMPDTINFFFFLFFFFPLFYNFLNIMAKLVLKKYFVIQKNNNLNCQCRDMSGQMPDRDFIVSTRLIVGIEMPFK